MERTIDVKGRTLELIGDDSPYYGQKAVEKGELQVQRVDLKVRRTGERYYRGYHVDLSPETEGRQVISLTLPAAEIKGIKHSEENSKNGYEVDFIKRVEANPLKIGSETIAILIWSNYLLYRGKFEEPERLKFIRHHKDGSTTSIPRDRIWDYKDGSIGLAPRNRNWAYENGGITFAPYAVMHNGKVIYKLPEDEPQYLEKLAKKLERVKLIDNLPSSIGEFMFSKTAEKFPEAKEMLAKIVEE